MARSARRRPQVSAEWINQHGESGAPYDFVLHVVPSADEEGCNEFLEARRADPRALRPGRPPSRAVVQPADFHRASPAASLACGGTVGNRKSSWRAPPPQVKSSAARTKVTFEMSRQELGFAEEQGRRFHVLRVSAAVSPEPCLALITDPIALWRSHRLTVFIVV